MGLTNAAGTLVERYTYSSYGTLGIYAANGTVRSSSTYANRYTYTGREWDAELRLYHFRARWYDPSTAGFISRDPLGYVDGMSLYRGYLGIKATDPRGSEIRVGVPPVEAITFREWMFYSSFLRRILELLQQLAGDGAKLELKIDISADGSMTIAGERTISFNRLATITYTENDQNCKNKVCWDYLKKLIDSREIYSMWYYKDTEPRWIPNEVTQVPSNRSFRPRRSSY